MKLLGSSFEHVSEEHEARCERLGSLLKGSHVSAKKSCNAVRGHGREVAVLGQRNVSVG